MKLLSYLLSSFALVFVAKGQSCGKYAVTRVQDTNNGISILLKLDGPGCNLYGEDIPELRVDMSLETEERFHVKISDANNKRWEVPDDIFPRPVLGEKPSNPKYRYGFSSNPFGFHVSRDTGEVLFNTTAPTYNPLFRNLVFEDQYLEISTILPDDAFLYGLGERVHPLRLSQRTYTIWTADETMPYAENIYGAHPFYMEQRKGQTHGVFLLNSNGMDITLQRGFLNYKVIGGVLDFYFFTGPTPSSVVSQYIDLIGKPFMIPFWSLGFHQCKWGYRSLNEVKEVVRRYRESNIPLETMWTDIDYMEDYKVWTFDPIRFPVDEVRSFVEELHQQKQKYVLITDPGIKNLEGFRYYEIGLEMDIYIKSAATGEPFVGRVWPGNTVFPDFLNKKSYDYWYTSIKEFLDLVPIDGIWIDMNEVANFCNGECFNTLNETETKISKVESNVKFDPNNPPYQINNRDKKLPLNYKALDMDAYHIGGILEYDAHSLYGISESIVTKKIIEELTQKRPFVLSRSTFPGSGRYTGHWTGDNFATWEHLYYSIAGILNTNIYGIPFIGADICGFIFDTTEELCGRWMQLGAFYPFSRNHNNIDSIPQEPYLWESVAESSRLALSIRYSLLNVYYTLFYHASTKGTTVVRPLFFEFTDDQRTWDIDRQFLVGSSLLVTPVLTQGADQVTGYFPKGRWYDFRTYTEITSLSGTYWELDAPKTIIPLHVRGGAILPLQKPMYSTYDTRRTEFSLLVALDTNGYAKGDLYLDDGESLNTSKFSIIEFESINDINGGKVLSNGSFGYQENQLLEKISILGVNLPIESLFVNGVKFEGTIMQDKIKGVVELTNLNLSMNAPFTLLYEFNQSTK